MSATSRRKPTLGTSSGETSGRTSGTSTEASITPRPASVGEPTIHRHRWNPPEGTRVRPRGVYLLHGMSEHAARYERLGARLASLGWRVGAHDHPGHGRSDGRRGVLEEPDELVERARVEIAAFTGETGAAPHVFAHSLGGVVVLELVNGPDADAAPGVAGLVLSAPAIVPRLSRSDRAKLAVLSALAPSYALEMPYDASRLTSDPDEIAAAHADALIHRSKSASLVRWLIDAAERAIERAPRLAVPTLVLVAGEDFLIDTARTREFVARLPSGLAELRVYDGHRHELLNETPERRERIVADIVRWLEERDAAADDAGARGGRMDGRSAGGHV